MLAADIHPHVGVHHSIHTSQRNALLLYSCTLSQKKTKEANVSMNANTEGEKTCQSKHSPAIDKAESILELHVVFGYSVRREVPNGRLLDCLLHDEYVTNK